MGVVYREISIGRFVWGDLYGEIWEICTAGFVCTQLGLVCHEMMH